MPKKKVTPQVIGKTLRKRKYFLPEYGETVEAESHEQAVKIVKKGKK